MPSAPARSRIRGITPSPAWSMLARRMVMPSLFYGRLLRRDDIHRTRMIACEAQAFPQCPSCGLRLARCAQSGSLPTSPAPSAPRSRSPTTRQSVFSYPDSSASEMSPYSPRKNIWRQHARHRMRARQMIDSGKIRQDRRRPGSKPRVIVALSLLASCSGRLAAKDHPDHCGVYKFNLITRQRQPVLASGKASGWFSAQRMRGGGSWFGDRIGD